MIATAIVPATTTVIAPTATTVIAPATTAVIETMSNYDGVRRRKWGRGF